MEDGYTHRLDKGRWETSWVLPVVSLLCCLLGIVPAQAQTFSSGSTGADGALDFTGQPNGTIIDFDPTVLNLDPEGDGIYHFTTITIPLEVTVRLRADKAGSAPLHWLATGNVLIDGTLDLNGNDGHDAATTTPRVPAVPGPGGFAGGVGGLLPNIPAQNGFGPGGGCAAGNSDRGGNAGHVIVISQTSSQCTGIGGLSYGNPFLLPLLGGSGGAGGGTVIPTSNGTGGGAGGGAIVIASTTSITVNGTITANGGSGLFNGNGAGGRGSGGAIRLVAPTVAGTGTLSTNAGALGGSGFAASRGRVLIEATQQFFNGTITSEGSEGVRRISLQPNPILTPTSPRPTVRVTSVGGMPVSANPQGLFDPVDVTLNSAAAVQIDLAAQQIPLGTTVTVTVVNEVGGTQVGTSSPLAGTLENSTGNVTLTIPAGFSRIYTDAKW